MEKREIALITVLTVAWGTLLTWLGWRLPLPVEASSQAQTVDQLWRIIVALMAYLFALVMVLMIYSLIAFRRRRGEEEKFGAPIAEHLPLEIVWTVIPVVIVLVLAVFGAIGLRAMDSPSPNEMQIDVTAFQWGWSFEYPKYGIKSSELRLPLGQPIRLDMKSLDVIHSFYVPEFRVKQDVVPGMTTHLWITPDKLGNYEVDCAELCGLGHSVMIAPVKVVTPEDFKQWVQAQAAGTAGPGTAADRGKELAQQNGCLSCHTIDGSRSVGPTWQGLYDSKVTLADGQTVKADEPYLRESIVAPGAKIVQGFPNIMPPAYGQQLTAQQINDLIAYIESLGEEEGHH